VLDKEVFRQSTGVPESSGMRLVNAPWATSSDWRFGMAQSVSQRWSSVRIRTMLGLGVVAVEVEAPDAE
jgi:hypothetical protein